MKTIGVAVFSVALACCAAIPASARTWTDSTGKYKIEAEMAGFENGDVELRKADGKISKVPLEKLSRADQQYVRARAAEKKRAPDAGPSGAKVQLKTATGSMELPAGSVLEMRLTWSAMPGRLPKGVQMQGVPAFAVRVAGADRPVLVTALGHFTSGPLPVPADRVGQAMKNVLVFDAMTGKRIAKGGTLLPVESAEATLADTTGDLLAMSAENATKLGTLELAADPPKNGEKIWLLQLPKGSTSAGAGRRPSPPVLLPGTVRSARDTRLTYLLDERKGYPQLGGAPLLNQAGQVVGIHVAAAEHAAGYDIGMANPATAIREKLRTAVEKASKR